MIRMEMMELNIKVENPQDEDKPWLVFINGLFADLKSWDFGVSDFTQEFRVLRYDGRGQGLSPRPLENYGLEFLVQDLAHLLQERAIEECFIIGLSNGARVGLEFASRFPQKVLGLVAADTYDRVTPLLHCKLSSWLVANRKGGALHRFEVATPWIWGETIMEERPELLAYYRERAGLEKVYVVEGLIEGAMENHEVDLTKIVCPTLLLVGEEDVLTPPFMHEKMVEKLAKGECRVVPGGHASLLEYPKTLSDVVYPWLTKLKTRMKYYHDLESEGGRHGLDQISG